MRNIFYLLAVSLLVIFSSCCNQDNKKEQESKHETAVAPTSSTGNFGEDITVDDAISVVNLPALLEGQETVEVKLTGDVAAVCQMSGCWVDVAMGNDKIIHVTFKDDSFLLPKDAAGKTAVIEGIASYEEIPVDMLKHIAEDEGKTQEEIDAIKDPKLEYTFIAKGVILF